MTTTAFSRSESLEPFVALLLSISFLSYFRPILPCSASCSVQHSLLMMSNQSLRAFMSFYTVHEVHGKYTGLVCHSLLQWITFCQKSSLWPIHLGWPYMAWFITSLSYSAPLPQQGSDPWRGSEGMRHQRMRWLDGITDAIDMNLGDGEGWGTWQAEVHGVPKSWTQQGNWTTAGPMHIILPLWLDICHNSIVLCLCFI